MKRWNPPRELSHREQLIIKRLKRTRKLFAFLRLQRHELFDRGFEDDLEGMYRQTGAGAEPVAPALLCMALLLQAYLGTSDAEAVELSVVDLRWQMVLGCLGAELPAFSQGGLQQFRERLIANDLDRRLLERTIELAKQTAEFDWIWKPFNDEKPRLDDGINLFGALAVRELASVSQFASPAPPSSA